MVRSRDKASARGATAADTLAKAYRDVFSGAATREQAQIVVSDLAQYSGFYQVLPPGATQSELAEANGKRAVYGRLFRFLRLSEAEIRALEEAARQEAVANQNEGVI